MKEWIRWMVRVLVSPRAVNAGFVLVCLAGVLGCPDAVVLAVSAVLYLVLAVIG